MRQHWDSTSLKALLNCPRKYRYRILEGWVTRVARVDLDFGIHYHKALEIYDKACAEGKPFREAQLSAAKYALTCGFDSHSKQKNRQTLTRAVVWYTEQWRSDIYTTLVLPNGKPAVELSFSLSLPIQLPDGRDYILCGHLDRVMTEATGDIYVCERKTTAKSLGEDYYRQFSPDIQVSIYTLATRVVLPDPAKGVMIDACQTLIEGTNFGRHLAARTPKLLEETIEEICFWVKQAETFYSNDFYPRNEAACFLCEYKDICRRDPSVREMWLKADYVAAPWRPEETR